MTDFPGNASSDFADGSDICAFPEELNFLYFRADLSWEGPARKSWERQGAPESWPIVFSKDLPYFLG